MKPPVTEAARDGIAPVILIVDPDVRSRKRLEEALEAEGYRVETAGGAYQGLRRFGDGTGIDLVLVDHRLPEMEGLAALAQLRERDPTARLVLLAEGGTVRLASAAVAGGASGFLLKESSAAVLCQAVRGYLSCPREPVSSLELPLAGLLPKDLEGAAPRVRVRTLNGFTFWRVPPVEGEGDRDAWTGRVYGVRSPWGERCLCELEVAPAVQAAVAAETGREVPAADPLWDSLCQLALSNYLGRSAALPPSTLPVSSLTGDQFLVLRQQEALLDR